MPFHKSHSHNKRIFAIQYDLEQTFSLLKRVPVRYNDVDKYYELKMITNV